ncbi:hypothetical protein GB928_004230 [Shinella curvata]|uniref:Uncharacterized protein n=1 Tax=Shinella curvata TaxID=1817964 RepID=A0ABT8X9U2_9HYPH|nr:hypothetical protein [Shinella curvata]MCJ8051669.1 hypothetical protein [Shinella curvata]MDO6120383.1 hypothetical protein [Shinella curvata]
MAADEMIVGELASFGAGQLRLRAGDILVTRVGYNASGATIDAVRDRVEKELMRLGIAEPKVLVVSGDISFEVIERA